MSDNKIVRVATAEGAPGAVGPYSLATQAGTMVFVSGQLPLNAETGLLAEGADAQTRQSLSNIAAVLKTFGLTMSDIVKTTIFVTDLNDFDTINAAYSEAFGDTFPARSLVQVAALPKGAGLEIEAIAAL